MYCEFPGSIYCKTMIKEELMRREERLEIAIKTVIDYMYTEDTLSKSYMISMLSAALATPTDVRHAILEARQSPHMNPRRKK